MKKFILSSFLGILSLFLMGNVMAADSLSTNFDDVRVQYFNNSNDFTKIKNYVNSHIDSSDGYIINVYNITYSDESSNTPLTYDIDIMPFDKSYSFKYLIDYSAGSITPENGFNGSVSISTNGSVFDTLYTLNQSTDFDNLDFMSTYTNISSDTVGTYNSFVSYGFYVDTQNAPTEINYHGAYQDGESWKSNASAFLYFSNLNIVADESSPYTFDIIALQSGNSNNTGLSGFLTGIGTVIASFVTFLATITGGLAINEIFQIIIAILIGVIVFNVIVILAKYGGGFGIIRKKR